MTHRLESGGWPVLEAMFDRDALVKRLRAGDLGHIKQPHSDGKTTRALALMLMDDGMSDELASLLEMAVDVGPQQREHAERFAAWVRAQAADA